MSGKGKRRAVAHLDLDASAPSDGRARTRSGTRRRQAPAADAPLVLVVDDDPAVRETLARMVAREYQVGVAADARSAVALCVELRPAIVVSDFEMPGVSGRELPQLLELAMGAAAPPVVIVTGGDMVRAAGPGIHRVLAKPIGLSQLLDTLAEVLRDAQGASSGQARPVG
jgi:DNA-binding response OmpR family regulator